jgi:serine/threonine-protein phosphatase 6 regulatory subunit 3
MHARQVTWKWLQWGLTTPMLPLQQILDKETFTLEELLDEDDLIQECKSLNGRLVN